MAERIDTPFTNAHFVAFCEKMLGMPYWYGAVVYKCTENLLKRKTRQYPSHYRVSRTARYKDDIAKQRVCADCGRHLRFGNACRDSGAGWIISFLLGRLASADRHCANSAMLKN